jgi:hypothetical protein
MRRRPHFQAHPDGNLSASGRALNGRTACFKMSRVRTAWEPRPDGSCIKLGSEPFLMNFRRISPPLSRFFTLNPWSMEIWPSKLKSDFGNMIYEARSTFLPIGLRIFAVWSFLNFHQGLDFIWVNFVAHCEKLTRKLG